MSSRSDERSGGRPISVVRPPLSAPPRGGTSLPQGERGSESSIPTLRLFGLPSVPSCPRASVPASTAHLALGSNLGDRDAHLAFAFDALGGLPGTALTARSIVFETDAVGPGDQGAYLNAAAAVETELPPRALLDAMLEIERERGRDRATEERWGPRTLDLDLLFYGDLILALPGLIVPHPRLHEREFVLRPLETIAPDLRHPVSHLTVSQMLDALLRRSA